MFKYFWGRKLEKDEAAQQAVTPAKPYRVVLHEGSMRDGREASIQFWDDDFTFRVITKKHVLLFRSPCLNEMIAYKKQHMRF
jgi:hypothetical protein